MKKYYILNQGNLPFNLDGIRLATAVESKIGFGVIAKVFSIVLYYNVIFYFYIFNIVFYYLYNILLRISCTLYC